MKIKNLLAGMVLLGTSTLLKYMGCGLGTMSDIKWGGP